MLLRITNLGKQYSQGLMVAGCAVSSALTIGFMWDETVRYEKRKLVNKYENEISNLKALLDKSAQKNKDF